MFFRNSLKHLHLTSIDSTQAFAKREYLAWNLSNMHLVTADEQTAGVGTFNKPWISPPCLNLYGTFVISLPLYYLSLVQNLSKILIISIVQSLHDHPIRIGIKWPNDIMLDKKKSGGILTETKTDGERLLVFLGFGLNINMDAEDFKLIDQPATSLKIALGHELDISQIRRKISLIFLRNFNIFKEKGLGPFLKKFRSHLEFIGHPVVYQSQHIGIMEGIDDQGHLQVKMRDGTVKSFSNGTIVTQK